MVGIISSGSGPAARLVSKEKKKKLKKDQKEWEILSPGKVKTRPPFAYLSRYELTLQNVLSTFHSPINY